MTLPLAGIKSVTSFYDYRDYLRAYVEYRQRTSDYSLSRLSKDAGFKAENYAGLIVNGKRNLTLTDALKLAELFRFNTKESRYFQILIRHNDTDNAAERSFCEEWLKELGKGAFSTRISPRDFSELLEHGSLGGILGCLSPVRGRNRREISDLTGLDLETVDKNLATLMKSSFAKVEKDRYFLDQVEHVDAVFGPHYKFKDHQQLQLKRSLNALAGTPANDAKFASNIFSIKSSDFSKLACRLREMIDSIAVGNSTAKKDSLVQLNVQLFNFKDGNSAV